MSAAAKFLNTDGVRLIERINEPGIRELVDRCAWQVATHRYVEQGLLGTVLARDKVYAEIVMIHLLARLVNNG